MKLVKLDTPPPEPVDSVSMMKAKIQIKGMLHFHQKDGSVINVQWTGTDIEVKPAGEPHGDSR